MNETVRPFCCSSAGCTQTFTNEDHLRVHEKKHDIGLYIGIETQSSAVDETPTPTRFIRNCEEVGLFQDLQNVNPFDETFQKAAELAKSGVLHVPETSTDDSLHTPNIPPPQEQTSNYNDQKKENSKDVCFTSHLSKDEIGDKVESILLACLSNDNAQTSELDRLSSTPSPDCLVISDDHDVDVAKNRQNESSANDSYYNVKSKLRETLTGKINNNSNNIFDITAQKDIELKIESIKQSVIFNGETFLRKPRERHTRKEINTSSGIDQNRPTSRKALDKKEMNRAAQFRSRQRKKQWIRKMENELDYLKKENKNLWLENQNLKFEVSALKKVFLLHKDCSVSKDPTFDAEVTKILHDIYGNVKSEAVSPNKKLKVAPIMPNPKQRPNIRTNFSANVGISTANNDEPSRTISTPVSLLVVPTVTVNSSDISVGGAPKLLTLPPGQACLLTPLAVKAEKSKLKIT